MEEEDRRPLRGAVHRGDGTEVVALLTGQPLEAHLQLAGDGLLTALQQGVDGATELARACAAALRARAWSGDEELAAQLDSALGDGPAPLLRPLPIDLDEPRALVRLRRGAPARPGPLLAGRARAATGGPLGGPVTPCPGCCRAGDEFRAAVGSAP